jgi:hypothetical protein
MARVLAKYGGREDAERRVHLFDSFDKGFSVENVHTEDDVAAGKDTAACAPTGEVMTSVQQVQANMWRWAVDQSRLVYHIGWVQETLPAAAGKLPQLALLRIDVDFYSPTEFVFNFLYDKVAPGGYIISDDWGEYELDHPHPVGPRLAAYEFFKKRGLPRPEVTRISCGTVWWRKPT